MRGQGWRDFLKGADMEAAHWGNVFMKELPNLPHSQEPAYDCVATSLSAWSPDKRSYCCSHAQVGCSVGLGM